MRPKKQWYVFEIEIIITGKTPVKHTDYKSFPINTEYEKIVSLYDLWKKSLDVFPVVGLYHVITNCQKVDFPPIDWIDSNIEKLKELRLKTAEDLYVLLETRSKLLEEEIEY